MRGSFDACGSYNSHPDTCRCGISCAIDLAVAVTYVRPSQAAARRPSGRRVIQTFLVGSGPTPHPARVIAGRRKPKEWPTGISAPAQRNGLCPGRSRNRRFGAGPCPVLPRPGFSSASLPVEYDRQIVRGHLTDFWLPEAVQHGAAGDILDIAQAPFRIARPQLLVERHVAR